MQEFTPSSELRALRQEIDSLDQELADILCRRLLLIHSVAPLKPRREDVRLPKRIEEIITNIKPIANNYQMEVSKNYQIANDYLEEIFRFIIEKSIQYEDKVWQTLHNDV